MDKLPPHERAARRAFLAAHLQALRERAALLAGTHGAVRKRLEDAAAAIGALLARQPADWRVWQLGEIKPQVQALIDGLTGELQAQMADGLKAAWAGGQLAAEAPLAAAGLHVGWQLPVLDASVLQALDAFAAGRISHLTAQALGRIDQAVSLTALGAATPWEAVRTVQAELGAKNGATLRRARTIVNTQLGEAYAVAQQARLAQSAALVPGLRKQWLRSRKIFSRPNHDAIDGQVVDIDQPFVLPTKTGTVRLMHPHDPKAPAGEIINCGCTARPWLDRWGLPPGAVPFSARELALNPMKRLAAAWLAGKGAKPV